MYHIVINVLWFIKLKELYFHYKKRNKEEIKHVGHDCQVQKDFVSDIAVFMSDLSDVRRLFQALESLCNKKKLEQFTLLIYQEIFINLKFSFTGYLIALKYSMNLYIKNKWGWTVTWKQQQEKKLMF